jgi:hypothetical protein
VRRIVATLLVVASPAVLAVPGGASDSTLAGATAVTALVPPAAVSAVPPLASGVSPAAPAPVPLVTAAPAAVRPAAVRAVRPRPITRADIDDTLYAEKLQADLCLARAIFCGLDRSGHYRIR